MRMLPRVGGVPPPGLAADCRAAGRLHLGCHSLSILLPGARRPGGPVQVSMVP